MTVLRTETRTIRPFIGLELADELLKKVQLKQGQRTYSAGSIVLPAINLKEQNFTIILNSEIDSFKKACEQANLNPGDVSLYVYANSRTLRKSTIIYDISIASTDRFPREITIENNDDELSRYVFNDSAGFQINVALVLNKNRSFAPLQIHKIGTYLARATFLLKPEEDLSSFAPEPLTDVLRNDFNIPKASMTFIYLQEDLLSVEDLSECVTVYLDSEILNLLLIDETDQVSKSMQINLAIQTIESLLIGISKGLAKDGLSFEDLSENSGALQFLKQLAIDASISIEDLINMSENDLPRIRSILESKFKLQSVTEQLLKRSQ